MFANKQKRDIAYRKHKRPGALKLFLINSVGLEQLRKF